MKSIGIVGCGAIGIALLRAAGEGKLTCQVAGITSRSEEKARRILSTFRNPPPYLELESLIAKSDLIVEAAGGDVVPSLARRTFDAGKDLMVISMGALLDHPEVIAQSREKGCRLYLPSGAIAGLDGIKSACNGEVSKVMMTTRKPPKALEGSPYLVQHGIELGGLTEEREVFSGSAREACRGFPANVNVSAAVSLAGLGPDRTLIRIVAVPGLERNCHDVEVEGDFGRLHIHIENIPGENPRTGRLTTLSMVRTLQEIADPVHIGT
ncbi:MAG: aspartate dehydrogenase [Deltaproteobacteria bacterium]|nr:aspartate dehydrogenase [Deltaproteobacteria bacterium]